MKSVALTAVLVLSVLIVSCRRHDFRTARITVPEMKNKACAEIVHKAVYKELARSKAMPRDTKIEIDLTRRTVTVVYESLNIALKNIEFAIAEAGFKANEVPAKPEAVKKLPHECFN